MGTLEDRYLSGDVDFETAVSLTVGMPVERESIVPLLRAMHLAGDLRSAAEISDHEADLYDQAGFVEDPVAAVVMAGAREARMRALIGTALTVEQAASRLGVSSSRIRQRLGARSLWAVKVGGKQLLPVVQFTDAGLVPNLDRVFPELPAGLHPLSVWGLLTTPRAELAVDEAPMSIVQWLGGGGDLVQTLDVVEAFTRGMV